MLGQLGSKNKIRIAGLLAAMLVIGTADSAKAVVILPGDNGIATTGSFLTPSGAELAHGFTGLVNGVDASNQIKFKCNIEYWVYQDTSGLDFAYKLTSDSSSISAIERLTLASFAGFSTDADTVGGSGTVSLETMDRSGTGKNFTFNFPSSNTVQQMTASQTSDLMVIKTNANTYVMGTAAVVDSGAVTTNVTVPFLNVGLPEPTSAGVVSLIAAGLSLRRTRRKASV